jgi:hypothetical protein
MSPHQLDTIDQPPTLHGQKGRGWNLNGASLRGKNGPNALVDLWLLESPDSHPIWHSYLLSLVHLRPIEDLPEPIIYLPGATHELVLYALDANFPRQDSLTSGGWHRLEPANFCAQFIASSDIEAIKRIASAARSVCAGTLSPDTDFRKQWIALFGDNMMRRD